MERDGMFMTCGEELKACLAVLSRTITLQAADCVLNSIRRARYSLSNWVFINYFNKHMTILIHLNLGFVLTFIN